MLKQPEVIQVHACAKPVTKTVEGEHWPEKFGAATKLFRNHSSHRTFILSQSRQQPTAPHLEGSTNVTSGGAACI